LWIARLPVAAAITTVTLAELSAGAGLPLYTFNAADFRGVTVRRT
jgi:hypothetical protein